MTFTRNKIFIIASLTLILSRILIYILDINLFGISYGFHLLDKSLLQNDLLKSSAGLLPTTPNFSSHSKMNSLLAASNLPQPD